METGTAKFKFGGIDRSVPITIGLAPKIEDATGWGVLALVRRVGQGQATINDCTTIVRLALASAGAEYDEEEALEAVGVDGILSVHTAAARILAELTKPPKKPKKGQAAGKESPVPN